MDAHEPLTHRPPPGGHGSGPQSARFGPAPEIEAEIASPGGVRRSLKPFITVALIVTTLSSVLLLLVVSLRRYVAVAKTAEVRNALAEIAKDAAMAHEPAHRVCPSATVAVPADASAIRGARKYQSRGDEWLVDKPSNAGFACLQFEMTRMQYFQYRYDASPSAFTARARGDLDGDGVFSDFMWSGYVGGDKLVIDRQITEKDAEE
jgi:hypothetical protein